MAGPEAEPGTNSKIVYQWLNGKHALLPGPHGRYGYDWFDAINAHCGGAYITPFYYQPWELMVQEVSLDRVCHLLYRALKRSFGGAGLFPEGIYGFFYVELGRGLPESEAWRRKASVIRDEFSTLTDDAERWVGDDNDRMWQVFDRLTVYWCLYREGILRRDPRRAIYYREKIVEVHVEVARHPVFSHVFDEYKRCARYALEADGLPARRSINREKVKSLACIDDEEQELQKFLELFWNVDKRVYDLLKRPPKRFRKG